MIAAMTVLGGCAHLAESNATFTGTAGQGAGPLVLRISRHMDTIVRGPDIDEDQLLVLELRNFELNRKLLIPSDNVRATFSVSRFGPSSKGVGNDGYVIVKSVSDERIVARVNLDIVARTSDGTYTQQVKFRGDHTFYRGRAHE